MRWNRIKRIARRILNFELKDEYLKGWKDGVNQCHYEFESARHGLVDPEEYWGEDLCQEE